MRTCEMVLFVIASMWMLAALIVPLGRHVERAAAGATALAAAAHLAFEGARFQMAFVYIVALGMMVKATVPPEGDRESRRRARRWITVPAAALIVVVAGVLPTVFPVFSYDRPGGPYGVGTAVYEVPSRQSGRTLVVQAWYPADPRAGGRPTGLTPRVDLLEATYASFTGLPRVLFDNLRLVKTHAVSGAPLPSDRRARPVILFSHGPLGANRVQSVFLMEALASHGYITFAIDHTGYSSSTIFPDGHAVGPTADAVWPVFVDDKSTRMLNTWVGDVKAVLDRLERLNRDDPSGLLAGRLDLSRVGYVGASFGGSVVVQALLDEPRIKAGVAQDGKPYFADTTPRDLHRPLMYMQSAAPYIPSSDAQLARWGLDAARFKAAEQDHYARQMRLFGTVDAPIYNVYVRGTDHVTFSDLYRIIAVPAFDRIDVRRAHRIINQYTIAFFDRYLDGRRTPLVDAATPSPFPEVTVSRRNVEKDL